LSEDSITYTRVKGRTRVYRGTQKIGEIRQTKTGFGFFVAGQKKPVHEGPNPQSVKDILEGAS
jgi:hypothetical protein